MDLKSNLAEKGIELRKIKTIDNKLRLADIFIHSLLGTRTDEYKVNIKSLSQQEKALLKKPHTKIQLILDLDGVFTDPLHGDFVFDQQDLFLMTRLIDAADQVVIWTNRLMSNKGPFKWVSWFPFWGKRSQKASLDFFNQHGHKLTIVKKYLTANAEVLRDLISGSNHIGMDVTYFVGSSRIDRSAVEEYADQFKNEAKNHLLVFFDTGHALI